MENKQNVLVFTYLTHKINIHIRMHVCLSGVINHPLLGHERQ